MSHPNVVEAARMILEAIYEKQIATGCDICHETHALDMALAALPPGPQVVVPVSALREVGQSYRIDGTMLSLMNKQMSLNEINSSFDKMAYLIARRLLDDKLFDIRNQPDVVGRLLSLSLTVIKPNALLTAQMPQGER